MEDPVSIKTGKTWSSILNLISYLYCRRGLCLCVFAVRLRETMPIRFPGLWEAGNGRDSHVLETGGDAAMVNDVATTGMNLYCSSERDSSCRCNKNRSKSHFYGPSSKRPVSVYYQEDVQSPQKYAGLVGAFGKTRKRVPICHNYSTQEEPVHGGTDCGGPLENAS